MKSFFLLIFFFVVIVHTLPINSHLINHSYQESKINISENICPSVLSSDNLISSNSKGFVVPPLPILPNPIVYKTNLKFPKYPTNFINYDYIRYLEDISTSINEFNTDINESSINNYHEQQQKQEYNNKHSIISPLPLIKSSVKNYSTTSS